MLRCRQVLGAEVGADRSLPACAVRPWAHIAVVMTLILVMALPACGTRATNDSWSDEFAIAGAPDPANWGNENGMLRNQELQWYQAGNATVRDGLLTIEARREPQGPAAFTSASLTSQGRREFQYGHVFVRARIDARNGLWPAIWTQGVNLAQTGWPRSGEIDIMEYYRGQVFANMIYEKPSVDDRPGSGDPYCHTRSVSLSKLVSADPEWSTKFHVWRMDWDAEFIRTYVDDMFLAELDVNKATAPDGYNPFRQKAFLMLNLAVGGINGGDPTDTEFPARFEVDYVRVVQ
jgi:beta-glucanase (GH16 family)